MTTLLRNRWSASAWVGAVVVGVAAAVGKWPHAWWWVSLVAAGLGALLPATAALLDKHQQHKAAAGRAIRTHVQGSTDHSLPYVREMGLQELRVHYAVIGVPYISRDLEVRVEQLLRSGRPILMVGSSMVGKTRLAAEVVRTHFADSPILVPDSKAALAELNAADIVVKAAVIWLDDIDRLIGSGGITSGTLKRLLSADNCLIGTIRARELDRYEATDEVKPPEWDVLSMFERIYVDRALTANEDRRLVDVVADEKILKHIRLAGIGEYVGGAQQVSDQLRLGRSASPVGYAIVCGAADWRRAGLSRPVPPSTLRQLAELRSDTPQVRIAISRDSDYAEGLAWATRQINPTVALVERSSEGFRIFDYALDQLSVSAGPISDSTWRLIVETGSPVDLISVGYSAVAQHRNYEVAVLAFNKAVAVEPTLAPIAGLGLGQALSEQGDLDGARSAFELASEANLSDIGHLATTRLASVLAHLGDVDKARATYQRVISEGDPQNASLASMAMGVMLAREGDTKGAADAYQTTIDLGHEHDAPMAMIGLGYLLADAREPRAAMAMYARAVESGDATAKEIASEAIARLEVKHGHRDNT